jgi:hypothetical protein
MGCALGGSENAALAAKRQSVIRFDGLMTAAKAAVGTGASWLPGWREVALPWDVADFAVAVHLGFVEEDDSGTSSLGSSQSKTDE